MASELEIVRPHSMVRSELTVEDMVLQVKKIQEVMGALMRDGQHFGTIPGTPKPTLYKPGAEKLCLLFRLDPQYESFETWDAAHLTVKTRCTLYHIPSGERRGSGEGSCSTKESKYAYRKADRKCPKCGSEAIIKGNAQYGGGWLCWKKKSGCGAKFADDDKAITSQESGRAANPDLPDLYNTVLKMSNKRALVAAVLNVTAASDIFTQDVEELPEFAHEPSEKPVAKGAKIYLEKIEALLDEHGVAQGNPDRPRLIRQVFGVNTKSEMERQTIENLREGVRLLEQVLVQRTHPGDESIPFGEEPLPQEPIEK